MKHIGIVGSQPAVEYIYILETQVVGSFREASALDNKMSSIFATEGAQLMSGYTQS
jgi:hypothetical protein